jgi:Protein of unknown function (DUF3237)
VTDFCLRARLVASFFSNLEELTMQNLNRRTVTSAATALRLILTIIGLAASATKGENEAPAPKDDKLQSELLLDLTLEAQTPHNLGSRLIVPVSGGTFTGPRLKGNVIPLGGDWITQRADGSRVLDVRILLQTDDGQKIYVSWRGIAYTPPGGTFNARITPVFETTATKYTSLNNVVAIGVYRPDLGKIAYRVYRIL